MFIRNAWYVAAYSAEVGADPVARRLLNEPVVLYRTEGGEIVALEDSCPHRRLPLSLGKIVRGDRLQCPYHGLEFDASGACVFDPETKKALPWAQLTRYPVAERDGYVFVWMGAPDFADVSTVPGFYRNFNGPGLDTISDLALQDCNYRMVIDNLMDLSHLGYVHGASLGNQGFAENATYKAFRFTDPLHGEGVRVRHLVSNAPCPPAYRMFGDYIDRWTIVDFYPPCYIHIRFGTVAGGTLTLDFPEYLPDTWEVFHVATPSTETKTLDFWAHVCPSGIFVGEEAVVFEAAVRQVIAEDEYIYRHQQAAICADPKAHSNDVEPKGSLRTDQGLWLARRLVLRREAEEQTVGDAREAAEISDFVPSA